jgi:16S rRNA (cytosine1402-N4)-methyltransferase
MLFDLGVSSMQFDQKERGFSFSQDGFLDMRMDPTQFLNASVIVNTWSEQELARIFRDYEKKKDTA